MSKLYIAVSIDKINIRIEASFIANVCINAVPYSTLSIDFPVRLLLDFYMRHKSILFALLAVVLTINNVNAQQYFRIGTGGTSGTYYPIGVLVAQVVSQPNKIIASAQTSNGSLGNVIGIASGSIESGFVQADVASWAQKGTGIFEGRPALGELRLIANLYPESLHMVVRQDSAIQSVADLKGKRIALDEVGSGTLVNARQVLAAYGLEVTDVKAEYIKPKQASDKLKAGTLDAFFFTGGTPAMAITELADSGVGIRLLPIDGAAAARLRATSPFLFNDVIPANTYKGVGAVQTLAVGAQWVTNEKISADTVYQITKALFTESSQKVLRSGHPKGLFITKENAVKGVGIPFHPGAMRFYKEIGVLK